MNEPNPNGVRVPKGILKNSSNRPPEPVQDYGTSAGSGYQPSYGYNVGLSGLSHPDYQAPGSLYSGEYAGLSSGHVPTSVPPPHQPYLGAMSAQWGHYYEGLNPQQHAQPAM